MTDDLSHRPDFGPEESLPWEVPEAWTTPWPYGHMRGIPLYQMSTKQLMEQRDWIERTGGAAELLPIIEDILHARMGE